jgi:hypothetical protein
MRKKSEAEKDNVHIGLNIPRAIWEKFCSVAQAYDDLPTHAVIRQIKKAVDEWHIHGFEKKKTKGSKRVS